MKGLENIKKIKSPKVSPKKRNNKSYDKFLKGHPTSQPDKDKKVIKVQRKRNSPKRVTRDIQDINEIERKMIQMKNNTNIKVPTQNTNQKKDIPNPIIQNPERLVPKVESKKKQIYNGPQMNPTKKTSQVNKRVNRNKVRISDIDVREKRPDEILTEHKKPVVKKVDTKHT